MDKELHIWLNNGFPEETLHDYESVYTALDVKYQKIVHTTNTHFCQTNYIVGGYRLFVHLNNDEHECIEITFGTNNKYSNKDIRVAHNLEKLLLAGEFGCVRNINNIVYLNKNIPNNYVCSECGKTHIKLWRLYQSTYPKLLCAECAGKNQIKDILTMDKNGTILIGSERTDQIGWYVPAILDKEGFRYLGYSSIPEEDMVWWRSLSNK